MGSSKSPWLQATQTWTEALGAPPAPPREESLCWASREAALQEKVHHQCQCFVLLPNLGREPAAWKILKMATLLQPPATVELKRLPLALWLSLRCHLRTLLPPMPSEPGRVVELACLAKKMKGIALWEVAQQLWSVWFELFEANGLHLVDGSRDF